MYTSRYSAKESLLQALDEWGHIASDVDISKAALSYRWITFHSALKGGMAMRLLWARVRVHN
jgi:aflatoxin B1 aldehyde reductase